MKTQYVCPICGKTLSGKDGLEAHKKRMHGGDNAGGTTPPVNPDNQDTQDNQGETLELDVKPQTRTHKLSYHCVDCGNPVEFKQSVCAKCGAVLDWSAI